jgi:hypothetical protein
MQPTRAMGSGLTDQFPQAQNMSDFPAAAHDLLGLDGLLTAEERYTRDAVRRFMVCVRTQNGVSQRESNMQSWGACMAQTMASRMQETEVAPIIADHWERASFPFEIIPKLRKLNLGEHVHRLRM